MSSGINSNLPYKFGAVNEYTEVKINPPNAIVRKIVLFVDES